MLNKIFNMQFGGVLLMLAAPAFYVCAPQQKQADPTFVSMLMMLETTGSTIVGAGYSNNKNQNQ